MSATGDDSIDGDDSDAGSETFLVMKMLYT